MTSPRVRIAAPTVLGVFTSYEQTTDGFVCGWHVIDVNVAG